MSQLIVHGCGVVARHATKSSMRDASTTSGAVGVDSIGYGLRAPKCVCHLHSPLPTHQHYALLRYLQVPELPPVMAPAVPHVLSLGVEHQ